MLRVGSSRAALAPSRRLAPRRRPFFGRIFESAFKSKMPEELEAARREVARNAQIDNALAHALAYEDARAAGEQDMRAEMERFVNLFPEAIANSRAALGDLDAKTLALIVSYAGVLQDLGRGEEAVELYEEALRGRRLLNGDRHDHTLGTLNDFSLLLAEIGRADDALALALECLAGRIATLGPNHEDTLNTLGNLGIIMVQAGQVDEGLKRLRAVTAVLRDDLRLDPGHQWRKKFEAALLDAEARELIEDDKKYIADATVLGAGTQPPAATESSASESPQRSHADDIAALRAEHDARMQARVLRRPAAAAPPP